MNDPTPLKPGLCVNCKRMTFANLIFSLLTGKPVFLGACCPHCRSNW